MLLSCLPLFVEVELGLSKATTCFEQHPGEVEGSRCFHRLVREPGSKGL